jgi:hypothetical protein
MNLVSKDNDNYVFAGKLLIDKVGKCGLYFTNFRLV